MSELFKPRPQSPDLAATVVSPHLNREAAERSIMKAIEIKWDTDGDKTALAELPREVEIPKEVEAEFMDNDEDAIADWLSDEYGYCMFGFSLTN